MDGDAVCTRHLSNTGSNDRFWFYSSPGLAECGDMINIDMQSYHKILQR
jgi:hypothetical protein